MGDKQDGNEPSLELPGLFGRKGKKAKPEPQAPSDAPEAASPVTPVAPEAEPEPTQVLTPPPVVPAEPAPSSPPAPAKKPRFSRRTKGLDGLDQHDGAGLDQHDRAGLDQHDRAGLDQHDRAGLDQHDGEPREFSLPPLPSRAAAAVTGVVVGLIGAVLTWAALQGCAQVRGTDSCGGPGFLILLVILAVMITVGALLLTAWEIGDAKSTSALAIGVVCVLVLLLLMEQLLEPWMFLVVPVLCALSYLAAHWVTASLVEEDVS